MKQEKAHSFGFETNKKLYSQKLILRPYEISEIPTGTLDSWTENIERLLADLKSLSHQQIYSQLEKPKIKPEYINGYTAEIIKLIKDEIENEKELKILAIGLWFLREKGPWHGPLIGQIIAGVKLAVGGVHTPESFIGKNAQQPSCLDAAAIVKELANKFNISGEIKRYGSSPLAHRFWQANTGEISDPMWAWKRGGFLKDEQQFRQYIKDNPSAKNLHKLDWEVNSEF